MRFPYTALVSTALLLAGTPAMAAPASKAPPVAPLQAPPVFTLRMPDPATHLFDVELHATSPGTELMLTMPVWTPGYYQRMDYAGAVQGFGATNGAGDPLPWRRDGDSWHIAAPKGTPIIVRYHVLAARDFVAANYLDAHKGYISPAGVFPYPDGGPHQPVEVRIEPYAGWQIATGLEPIPNLTGTFRAEDFDTLYDSPILIGTLERMPPFLIHDIPHDVVGVDLGTTDRSLLNEDLRKIITAATDMMADIPYRHYDFLEMGQTRGGIEHLNSAAVGFGTQDNRTPEGRIRLDSYLAHEYFHNFNVKRIRPIELGPFDYQKENRTHLLWVSEGFTVYYESILLRRAGLIDRHAFLSTLSEEIRAYENQPGHLYQSLSQASYETWEDGPFGRQGDSFNKTISYYDKGPVIGFMLDLAIRHATGNRHSLDDVMRALYRTYYKEQHCGFTDSEFRQTCEQVAGASLAPLFAYVDTTAEPDYARYLGYAGLVIDTRSKPVPGGWLGITLAGNDGKRMIADVDWKSPAWNAGIQRGDRLIAISGLSDPDASPSALLPNEHPGQTVRLTIDHHGRRRVIRLLLVTKTQRTFDVSATPAPTALQRMIWDSF